MADEPWTRLAELVRRQREQRHLSQRDVAIAAGTTDRLISSIERAERTTYKPQNLRAVSEALGWTASSIDQILSGGDPTPTEARAATSVEDRLTQLEAELRDLRAQVEAERGQSKPA